MGRPVKNIFPLYLVLYFQDNFVENIQNLHFFRQLGKISDDQNPYTISEVHKGLFINALQSRILASGKLFEQLGS